MTPTAVTRGRPVAAVSNRLRSKLEVMATEVCNVVRHDESLTEVWLSSPGHFSAGDVLVARIGGNGTRLSGAWRRYTVAQAADSMVRLIIETHPHGALGRFFAAVEVGDAVDVRGPRSPVHPPPGNAPLIVVGDLTALATIASVDALERLRGASAPTRAAVVIGDRSDAASVTACLPDLAGRVSIFRQPAELDDWLAHCFDGEGSDSRLLAVGEHGAITRARDAALRAGAGRRSIRTHAYWKPGRRGLE
jgi:NADPH-dependent ferric siderophore reductase